MKRIAILGAVLAAVLGSAGAASAIEVDVGANGVYVGPRDHYRDRDFRRCRVVVRTHINRFGERVTERRRICRD